MSVNGTIRHCMSSRDIYDKALLAIFPPHPTNITFDNKFLRGYNKKSIHSSSLDVGISEIK